MFDPKSMTTRELELGVDPARERAAANPILPDADLTKLQHIPGIDGIDQCAYSGNTEYQQVADYRCPTCPVCLKIIADAIVIELDNRYGGS